MTFRAAVSWSGGKDACLALVHATEQGLRCDTLLTMVDPDGLSKSHALARGLLAAQAESMAARLLTVATDHKDYGTVFAATLRSLRDGGTTHMVFGDIDLQAHRDWLEPVCRTAGIYAVFPLWGMSRRAVSADILARGIRATTVCVDTRWLDASFCGVAYDRAFLDRLPEGVCPCGENGEFHTFAWDAPCFSQPLYCVNGRVRRVRASPPFVPTEFVYQSPLLLRDTA